jgi:predicted nucleotidyltransferase
MVDIEALLKALTGGQVEFILIGGAAAIAHGSARDTVDLDVVYRRTAENIGRLVSATRVLRPYLRGAPPGLPFEWDARTVEAGLNFTLTTSAGDLDLLGEITGGGRYEDLLAHTIELNVFGAKLKCLDLEKLIQVKRAAGRPKDLEAIAELSALLEERGREP